jgi:DNA adenine methylase
VLLRKPRSYGEVYNDLDGEMVNLFRVARDHGDELLRRIELTPFAREEFDQAYAPAPDPIEQARRTVTRAALGFGSTGACGAKTGFRATGWRSNAAAPTDWRNYPEPFPAIIDRLRGVVIENRPAAEVMAAQDNASTLFYVDPPYVLSTRSMRNEYCKKGYRFELRDEEHEALAQQLRGLAGMVVVSGYHCELYDRLFEGWARTERDAHADGGRDRVEVLWLNDAASRALREREALLL